MEKYIDKAKKNLKENGIEEICIGKPNEYIEVARLAPSALNKQPWKFKVENDVIHIYCKKCEKRFNKSLKILNRVGIGIALSHMFELSKAKQTKLEFIKFDEDKIEEIPKYDYIISVKYKESIA